MGNDSRLTRIRDGSSKGRGIYSCTCGNEKECDDKNVRTGNTRSCGCYRKEQIVANNTRLKTKHGKAGTPLYQVWNGAKQRCTNPEHKKYKDYGGRGITMCPHLQESLENFIACAGVLPGSGDEWSIDRINNDGGYWCGKAECSDCGPAKRECNIRWTTRKVQANNRRTNRLVEYRGRIQTVCAWADELGIHRPTLLNRLNKGMSPEEAFTVPLRKYTKRES